MKNTRKARIFKTENAIDLVCTLWQQSKDDKPKHTSDVEWQRNFLFTLTNLMWCTLEENERLEIIRLAIKAHEEVTLDTI